MDFSGHEIVTQLIVVTGICFVVLSCQVCNALFLNEIRVSFQRPVVICSQK